MNNITDTCLTIAAGICLNGPAQIEVSSSPNWTGATIRLGEAVVISTVRTDNFAFPDRRRMQKACSGEACIYYYKHCASSKAVYSCVVHYNWDGDEYNRSLRVEGPTAASVNATLSKLSIVVGENLALIRAPNLTVESSGEVPPYCRPGSDPGCK